MTGKSNGFGLSESYEIFVSAQKGVVPEGQGKCKFLCPCHDDTNPSAHASIGENGKVVAHCFSCNATFVSMVHASGLTMGKLFPSRKTEFKKGSFATPTIAIKFYETKCGLGPLTSKYAYQVNGVTVGYVARFDPPGKDKEFRPIWKDGRDWIVKAPKENRPLYRGDDIKDGCTVFVTEGEKACEAAKSINLVAISPMNGAKSPHKTDWSKVKDHDVVILRDNDDAGLEFANRVAGLCLKAGATSVKIVLLPVPNKGDDIVEWIENHGDAATPDSMKTEIDDLIAAAPDWVPSPETISIQRSKKAVSVVEPPNDPHRLARLFVKQNHTIANGLHKLAWWQGSFWNWDGLKWKELKRHEFLASLTACIKAEFDRINLEEQENWEPKEGDDKPPKVLPVIKSLLNNVENAVASIVAIPDHVTMPDWLSGDPPFPAHEVLSTTDRLLHLPSLISGTFAGLSPTPMLFTANCLNYTFDPVATCPHWHGLMNSIWPDDPDSIESLQEWFGYLLLPDTRQHKLLMLIGPPRSGKGTITRVLQSLLGEGNVASPTLSSLSGPFGLWPLLNRFVALIPDARLSGRDDAVAVVERILSITGEDPQDIHRKSLPTLTGVRMPIRFVLMSNELPNMKDASGAFMTRVVLLRMTESFIGREDRKLGDKLSGELPGILNWSIEGWKRLNQRGHFLQPGSATELLDDLENLSSPIKQFVADACDVGSGCESTVSTLFYAWDSWCDKNHQKHRGTIQTFGRDLRAALPQIKQVQRRNGDGRERGYVGIQTKYFR